VGLSDEILQQLFHKFLMDHISPIRLEGNTWIQDAEV
jgi:hypothetical protein